MEADSGWKRIFLRAFVVPTLAPGASAGVRGYGMGYGMPMSMMGFGFGGVFMLLLQIGLLVLVALGIAYLWKKLTEKPIQ